MRRRSRLRSRCRASCRAALAAVFAAAAGCAVQPAGPHPGIGWRTATVVAVGPADALGPAIDGDCRKSRAGDAPDDRTFALVQYYTGRSSHLRIVPLAAGQNAQPGDAIYIGLLGCRESPAPP